MCLEFGEAKLSQTLTKDQQMFYEVTENQREQLLNRILDAICAAQKKRCTDDASNLNLLYRKVQALPVGGSLKPEVVVRLKSLLNKHK